MQYLRLSLIYLFCFVTLLYSGCNEPDPVQPTLPLKDVTIKTDLHGIPHIYAANDTDVIFAQGYMMAGLRGAQNELFRVQSFGRSSEIYGEDKLTEDMLIRTMNFQGFAHQNWAAFSDGWPHLAAMMEAFAAGINHRYAEYRANGWPSTFQLLRDRGYEPADWTGPQALGVAQLLGFGLSGSPEIELLTTIGALILGNDLANDLVRFQPPVSCVSVPGFLDQAAALTDTTPDPLKPRKTGDPRAHGLTAASPEVLLQTYRTLEALRGVSLGGSNNWAVHGDKMASGISVLESDTHQGLPIPGAYVLMHLISNRNGGQGTQDIIGSAFPGAPSVVFGHNQHVAWAPTIGFADLTDFYIEFSDPNDRTRVLRPGGESLPTIERPESFKIRKDDGSYRYESVTIHDIPGHGPILPPEMLPLPIPVKISVRWAGASLPGPVGAVYELSQSQSVNDMFNALREFRGGTIGFAMADTQNNIAYSLWTKLPKRDASTVFRPWVMMPGDTGPHWEGYLPHEAIPYLINPDSGYVRSANNDPAGGTLDNQPGNDAFYYGYAYSLGYRCESLDRALGALTERGDITMPELEQVQKNRDSIFAEQLIPYFADAATRRADLVAAYGLTEYVDHVTSWNMRATTDSAEATIFYSWAFQFVADMMLDETALLEDRLGGSEMQLVTPGLIHWLKETAPIIDQIDAGTTPFPSRSGINFFDDRGTPDHIETRDELIIEALHKAIAHLKQTFADGTNGPLAANPDDVQTWEWRKMLSLRSRHSLAKLDKSWEKYDVLWGAGGNFDTPNVASYTAIEDGVLNDQFILGNAPSNRYLWEMHPDGVRGKFMVPWAQSEIPDDPHYLDLVPDYVDYVYRDFPYTDEEIDAVLADEFVLEAGSATAQ